MRYKTVVSSIAIVFIAAGLAFILRGWSLFWAIDGWVRPDVWSERWEWRVLSFAYLFGAMLLGSGFLTWAVRHLRDAATQTRVLLGLFGLNALAGVLAWTQFTAIWHGWGGGVMVFILLTQAIVCGWALVTKPRESAAATEPEVNVLREQWAQHISAAAAQQERNRLARELHDSIKQQLFSINVGVATAQARWATDDAGARNALAVVRDRVREASAEMEAMLHNLRPVPLETHGLIEALRRECEALQYRTGAQITTEIGSLPEATEWPPGAQEAVFRIAQEAFSNIARHARAQNVQLRFYQQTNEDDETLWLKISDDGTGFAAAHAVEGMGLANMRTRALEVGGAAQVESQPEKGTMVVVRIPLRATESSSIKRDLQVALVFAVVGLFIGGLGGFYSGRNFWPVLCVPLFWLSGLSCYRARQALQSLRSAETNSHKRWLELRILWEQVTTVVVGATLWSTTQWLVFLAALWQWLRMVGMGVGLFWMAVQVFALWRLHQGVSEQAQRLSSAEFCTSLRQIWERTGIFTVCALWVLLMMFGFKSLTSFYVFAPLLSAQWLYLSARLLLCRVRPQPERMLHD